jgi:rod shape-determining protein MreB and related proteins
MVHQAYCSSVAMNLLFEKKHFVLIDFSASKIEISVIANGLVIALGLIKIGTWKIFRFLKNHFFRKHKMEVTEKEIETLVATLKRNGNKDEVKIKYKNIETKEIDDLMKILFSVINDELVGTMELAANEPEIEKIIRNGVYFTGGGSTFEYLLSQIKLGEGIQFHLSKTPLLDNIEGLKIIMGDKLKFKEYLMI